METIFDLIKKQVNLLVEISKNDSSILLNLFDLVKETKIPFQLPLSEKEIQQIIDNKSNHCKDLLALKFDKTKNTDIVLVGIYSKHYENKMLYIGAFGDLSERVKSYALLKDRNNKKVKKLDAELIKKGQTLSFLPIIFCSIPFKYKNLNMESLIEKIFALEDLLITAIKKQNNYILLNDAITENFE